MTTPIHFLSSACTAFLRFAAEEIDYEKADRYADYIVGFFKISDNHPKYQEAENKIKNFLKTAEGQQGLSLAYSLFLNGLEKGKDLQKKACQFYSFLDWRN